MLDFSDFTYVSADTPSGGGTVLVPLASLPGRHRATPPNELAVYDLSGRSVVYAHSGPTFYADSEAGTRQFVGWSYWESESTEDLDAPIVHLMVLAPGFGEADYH